MDIVFRIDDVSPNTDMHELAKQMAIMKPHASTILLGVNLIARTAQSGALYPDLPLRSKDRLYFYEADRLMGSDLIDELKSLPKVKLASHGLLHGDHSRFGKDAVEMSILTSCALLNTRIFIPPFNETSETVKIVCKDNNIEIIGNCENRIWKSLESEPFDPAHKFWYYHPWRLNLEQFKKAMMVPV